jgi:hypothetical protein
MSARLRRFLDEVREDFWAHDYEEGGDANDLLVAAGRVLENHPEITSLDLLRDIWDLDLTLYLDSSDPDVMGILDAHDTLQGILDDLLANVVRQILRDEDRPEGWQSLPIDQRDGLLTKEDKRRIELARRELDAQYRPQPPD